jgi:hypothetical protein
MGRILAHGTGPGHDPPIQLFYAVAGGALAVFASFLAVGLLWPESRLRGAAAGRPAAVVGLIVDPPAIRWTAAAVFGSRWFDRGDAFEAYSELFGRLAPLGRRRDGVIVVRNPLNSLDAVVAAPGLVAVVCLLLASTAFDSLTLTREASSVVLTFGGNQMAAGSPFAPELVAAVQVLAIVTGHVLGVIAAHDRAVRLFEPRTAISGQIPLMVLMVIVTISGLSLLAVG